MTNLRAPPVGLSWLPGFASDIAALFKQKLSAPLWLWGAPTADLPTLASQGANEGALAYDETTNQLVYYDVTAWRQLFGSGNAALNAIAALTPAADRYIYFTSGTAAALGTITAFARNMLDDVDGPAVRLTLALSDLALIGDGAHGDITISGAGAVFTIPAATVTLAKMANIATDRLIGRDTTGTGAPEALTVGGGVEFTGSGGIQTAAFTGDATKAAGGVALTLATVNSNTGTYGGAATVAQISVNGKGLITGVSAVTIAIPFSQLTSVPTTLSGHNITLTSGNVTTALSYTPLNPANNLSDLANAATARGNLGFNADVILCSAEVAAVLTVGNTAATTTSSQLILPRNAGGSTASITSQAAGPLEIDGVTAIALKVGTVTEATVSATGINLASGNTLSVNGTRVVTSQQTAISDAAGALGDPPTGAEFDALADKFNTLLVALRNHGLIAT